MSEHTVYAVLWDDLGVLKVGSSHRKRWQRFVHRGARVVSLRVFQDASSCYLAEGATHRLLREIFPRAFTSKGEAQPHLGAGGSGWAECYRVSVGDVSRLSSAADQSSDSYGRTDVRTDEEVSPFHRDIFPVRYAHASRKAL